MRTLLLSVLGASMFSLLYYVALTQQTPNVIELPQRIPFEFSEKDFGKPELRHEKKELAQPPDNPSMPYDAPAHTCYHLEATRPLPALDKGPRYFHPAYSFVCIVPTTDPTEDDFSKSYPTVAKAVAQIKALLKNRPKEFRQFDDVFDFPYNNAGWAFKTKVSYLDHKLVKGVFFVTQYTQELTPNPANNEELTANFQGITQDGKYYLAARFSISHPKLPRGIDFTDDRVRELALKARTPEEINARTAAYLKLEERKVSQLDDREFQPSLPSIKRLLSSINP